MDLRRFLKEKTGVISLLHEAAAKPGCCFGRDYGHFYPDTRVVETGELGSAVELLALDARGKVADGDARALPIAERFLPCRSISCRLTPFGQGWIPPD